RERIAGKRRSMRKHVSVRVIREALGEGSGYAKQPIAGCRVAIGQGTTSSCEAGPVAIGIVRIGLGRAATPVTGQAIKRVVTKSLGRESSLRHARNAARPIVRNSYGSIRRSSGRYSHSGARRFRRRNNTRRQGQTDDAAVRIERAPIYRAAAQAPRRRGTAE